ncbi:MAG TPA: flagellin, partial [Firmicutes bacterium]|nr:flagellin [Bacillota bacterium]
SEKMRAQIGGMKQAIRNAQDGISMIQTAEGALNETHAILNRMRELAVQASNGTLKDDDRAKLEKEFVVLNEEITRIANDTEFNTMKLFDGNLASVKFQIGANAGQMISGSFTAMRASDLGIDGQHISGADATQAQAAITALDSAIGTVSETRANLGAIQNRLEHTIANLGVTMENLAASESRIRDVDMAQEMTQFTKNQILIQSATAMLAQANMKPQAVLQLLG